MSDADDVRLGDSDEEEEDAELRQQRRRGAGFAGNRDVAADEGADDEVGSQLSGMSYPIHVVSSDGSGAGGASGGGGEDGVGGAAAEQELMRQSLNAAGGQEGKGDDKDQEERHGAQPVRRSGGRFGALLGAVARGVGSAGGAGVRAVGSLVAQAVLRPVVNAGERAAATVAAEQQRQQQEDEQGQQEQPGFDAQGVEASPQGGAGGAGVKLLPLQPGGQREVLATEQEHDDRCEYADKEELD